MVIHGHVENGIVIPHDSIPLPEGAEVTIMVHGEPAASKDGMTEHQQQRYLALLARIDAVANEDPGDSFRGADHDRVLYGDRS
jgi:hypothetical protein